MPQRNRKSEIIKSILDYLEIAQGSSKRITNRSLMKVANCSSKTFYKHVKKGSEVRRKIDEARSPGRRRKDTDLQIAELKKTIKQQEKGNGELLAQITRLVAVLKRNGMSDDEIQSARNTPMPKPDRSVSHAGRSRRERRQRKYR